MLEYESVRCQRAYYKTQMQNLDASGWITTQ